MWQPFWLLQLSHDWLVLAITEIDVFEMPLVTLIVLNVNWSSDIMVMDSWGDRFITSPLLPDSKFFVYIQDPLAVGSGVVLEELSQIFVIELEKATLEIQEEVGGAVTELTEY